MTSPFLARHGTKALMAEHIISAVRNSVPAVATVSNLDHATLLAVSATINMAWCVLLTLIGCLL